MAALALAAAMYATDVYAQSPSSSRITSPTDTDAAVYAVSYVEMVPSSNASVAVLREYRDTSRKEDGCLRIELFEQIGRPGHFAIVETWKDQQASDAHGLAAHTKQFLDKLRPIRSSEYDQRPYKPLSVSVARTAVDGQAIYVVTHVDTLPAPQSDAPGLLKRLAEASRKEEGNLRFDVLQHATRANHFTIVETWRSQKVLDAHVVAANTTQYRDGLQPMSGSPLDERLYRSVD